MFRVFAFFSKKTSKNVLQNRDHIFPSKITQKSSPGTRFGTQNGPELTSGGIKNPKIPKKSRFWAEQFFEYFFNSKKLLGLVSPKWAGPEVKLKNYVSV